MEASYGGGQGPEGAVAAYMEWMDDVHVFYPKVQISIPLQE
jgi:hypothetical protein